VTSSDLQLKARSLEHQGGELIATSGELRVTATGPIDAPFVHDRSRRRSLEAPDLAANSSEL
jgi:hypothetical protein